MGRREDDQIIAEMLAPDVEEAFEALGFWLRRHARLPFYRRTARAEARRMITYWQRRSLADAPRAPLATLANAGPGLRAARMLIAYRVGGVFRRGATALLVIAALLAAATAR